MHVLMIVIHVGDGKVDVRTVRILDFNKLAVTYLILVVCGPLSLHSTACQLYTKL